MTMKEALLKAMEEGKGVTICFEGDGESVTFDFDDVVEYESTDYGIFISIGE